MQISMACLEVIYICVFNYDYFVSVIIIVQGNANRSLRVILRCSTRPTNNNYYNNNNSNQILLWSVHSPV